MKYPSATEVLSELETAKETGKSNLWENLVTVHTEDLVNGVGKVRITYKDKPLYVRIKDEQVVMGSGSGSMFDYAPTVKVGGQDSVAYKLIELVIEIVCNTEYEKITATETTTRTKEYNDTKYLDLKLYPSFVTIRDKEGIHEETITSEELKTPRNVNQVFKVGTKVSSVMVVGLWVSEKYVSVTAALGTQMYVDQRKCQTHYTFTQLKELFDIDLEEDDIEAN